jgi:hypothetical protein
MKRTAFILIALVLGGLALVALAPPLGAAPVPAPPFVVVDPLDLRQPVPDPEQGLTDKYDGKLVRFTAVVSRASVDKKTNKHHFELHYEIVQKAKVKGKETVVGKETIVVPVAFQNDEKALFQQMEQLLRAQKPGPTVTVEGKGVVNTDGTLVITDAVLVTEKRPFAPDKK